MIPNIPFSVEILICSTLHKVLLNVDENVLMEAKKLDEKQSIQYLRDVTGVFVLALKRICIPFCNVKFSERFKN